MNKVKQTFSKVGKWCKSHKVITSAICGCLAVCAIGVGLIAYNNARLAGTYKALEFADKGYLTEEELAQLGDGVAIGEPITTADGSTVVFTEDDQGNVICTTLTDSQGNQVASYDDVMRANGTAGASNYTPEAKAATHTHVWKPTYSSRTVNTWVVDKAAYTDGEWVTTGQEGFQCSYCGTIFNTGDECWAHINGAWTGKEWNTPGCCWASCVRLHAETKYIAHDHPEVGHYEPREESYITGYVCDCGAHQ